MGDLFAKLGSDVGACHRAVRVVVGTVFDHVVQQRRADQRRPGDLKLIGERPRDAQRVDDVGRAFVAHLRRVHGLGEFVGTADRAQLIGVEMRRERGGELVISAFVNHIQI